MNCSKCGEPTIKKGIRNGKQRLLCKNNHWTWGHIIHPGNKILLFDIETTPMEVFVWGLFNNKFISHDNVIADWNILSWSAKWLCGSKIMSAVQTPDEAIGRDDYRILGKLWQLMDQADIIIGHNIDRFDIKKINTRFYVNGYIPPSPYQTIDTLKVAKKSFAFSSNRLDYLGQLMTNKGKISTNFDLWKRCLRGESKALKEMDTYCRGDVCLTEEVYFELRPWIKSHPQVSWDTDGSHCPQCKGKNLTDSGGYYTATVNYYIAYRCDDCGSLSRALQSELTAEDRKQLMRPLPR